MKVGAKRFIGNMGWLLGGKLVNMLLQFAVSLATARYLGPSNFGVINYVAAYVSFFSSIASLGLSVVVIKEIASNEHDNNDIVWTAIWMRLAAAGLSAVSIVSLMLVSHREDSTIALIAALQSVSILFSAFDTVDYYFRAKLQAKKSSIAAVLAYAAMSLYRIVLLVRNADIVWFAFATSIDMIALTVFLMVLYVKAEGFRPKFRLQTGKRLLKQSYHYMIAGLITILYTQVDRVMLGRMLDTEAVGCYSVALTISGLWSMIPAALAQTVSPVLYDAAKTDRALYLRRLRQSYAVLFWLNVLFSVFVCILAREIILLLYGQAYVDSIGALRIVVWYYGISSMTALNQVYLANDSKNKYIQIFCLAGLIINVLLNGLLIPRWSISGAAAATLLTHLMIQVVIPYMFRDTREIAVCVLRGALLKDVLSKEELAVLKAKRRKNRPVNTDLQE